MKVLLINKFFFLNGGSERVLFQERDFLLKQGMEVIDFAMQDPRNLPSRTSDYFVSHRDYRGKSSPVEKVRQAAEFIHSREAVTSLDRLLTREKPRIAHLHNIYHQLTPSIIPVLKDHGVKVAVTLHDAKLICPGYLMLNKGKACTACNGRHFWKSLAHGCQGSSQQGLLLMLESYWHKWRKSYDQVDLFLTPSRFLGDLVTQRIPQAKIRLLRNGIDPMPVPRAKDEGYALFFGRLSREKGIETLLKAYKALPEKMELKIVGTGPLEEELLRNYPEASFVGYKHGQELTEIIRKAAFVVFPSECYENCSMVVLESMAASKPVIGSNIGGVPEQIRHGETGLLFASGNSEELGQRMHLLHHAPTLRRKMGSAARETVKKEFSIDNHCSQLLATYEDLLAA